MLLAAACGRAPDGLQDLPLTASVLAALRDARPYQLRLYDAQRRLPCAAADTTAEIPSASCAALPAEVTRSLAALAPRVTAAVRERATTDALWASALLDLASGAPDGRQLDRAIGRLTEVRARDTTIALASNHLAVAHVARAAVRGDARDLYSALDHIERAAERDSLSPTVSFNRSVIHALVGTTRRARVEFAAYALRESDARWRAEGAQRLAALPPLKRAGVFTVSQAAIAGDPQAAREFVLDSLLPWWSRTTLQGDEAGARAALAHVRTIGDELLSSRGDSSVVHIAGEVEGGSGPRRASGVADLVLGTRQYRATSYSAARAALERAVAVLLDDGAAALADWASLLLGASLMAQQQLDDARGVLASVRDHGTARGDRALQARATWASAIAAGRDGELDESERLFREARATFSGIGESLNAARMSSGLLDVLGSMGRTVEAAASGYQGHTEAVRAGGAARYEDVLIFGQQLGDEGKHFAAAHFLREAVSSTADGQRVKDLPEALGRLAMVQVAMGRAEEARRSVREARTRVKAVSDAAMSARVEAELDRAEARVVSATDPAAAMRYIDKSRAYFKRHPLDDGPLLQARAQLALQLGDSLGAARDLAEATRVVRSQARSALPAQARQLVATLRDAHRTLIALALARGDTALAFDETVRLPSIDLRSSDAALVRVSAMPSGRAEVRFVVLPGHVLTWVRTRAGRWVTRTVIPRDDLRAGVARFINVVRSRDDSVTIRVLGREFFASLLAPHEPRLAGVTALDVHADGVLADLPLSVLSDGGDRYLAERFGLRHIIPTGTRPGGSTKAASPVPLLVGNPAWRRTDFPGLEPLRYADEEVRQVAALYPRAMVLSGAGATKAALLRELPRHDVVHFAGHSRVVVDIPGKSHMVLTAGERFADGVLSAEEIAGLDLRGVKLVVLSSCGRTREDAASADEMNALVVAFLDAGVETVVAGLWEVEDARALEAVGHIHREMAGAAGEPLNGGPRVASAVPTSQRRAYLSSAGLVAYRQSPSNSNQPKGGT